MKEFIFRLFVAAVLLPVATCWGSSSANAMLLTDFQDLSLASESYWNGSDESGNFTSGELSFNNDYNASYMSWVGFAYSNMTDQTTVGYTNQYSAYVETPNSSDIYGVAYEGFAGQPIISSANPDQGGVIESIAVTNTTYAALSMLNGDAYAKKFGGVSGNDEDWFLVTFEGFNGSTSTGTVDFYLADYQSSNNANDYIISDWANVDLTSLGYVNRIELSFDSSDVGDFGINTPTYAAIGNVTMASVPEPSTVLMMLFGLLGLFLWRCHKR